MTPVNTEKALAVPALVVGTLALALGVIGFVLSDGRPGAAAGVLAVVASLMVFRLQRRLVDEGRVHRLVGDELRSVRAKARAESAEAEAEINALKAKLDGKSLPANEAEAAEATSDGPTPHVDDPAALIDEAGPAGEDSETILDGVEDGVIDTRGDGTKITGADFGAAVQRALDSEFEAAFDAEFDDFGQPGEGISLDPLSDPVSGLFNELFFTEMVSARVAAARRHLRPVATVVLEVLRGLPADDAKPANPDLVTEAIVATLRESDTAARLDNGTYAFLLEDTPENGAIWTVERVRRHLAAEHPDLSLRAGVACYPAHAFSAAELLAAADTALRTARDWRQDRIEVAAVAAD